MTHPSTESSSPPLPLWRTLSRLPARSALWTWAGIAAAYCLLTAAMFWPVVVGFSSAVPHDLGDPVLNAWILWWNAHVLPFTERWWNGPMFWPVQGVLSFSENLVGLSLVSTPLIRAGLSPAGTYNAVLLLSFAVSAFSAHLLAYRLCGRHDASFFAGILFGFAPYRLAQLPHLQVLAAWWMPLALLALHEAARNTAWRRRIGWLAAFSLCWLAQSLTNGYLLFYFSLYLLLWFLWFGPSIRWRVTAAALAAWGLAGAALLPVLLKYKDIHETWGFVRGYGEIVAFGADLTSFLTAPELLRVWSFRPERRGEQELYLGVVAVAFAVAGSLRSLRAQPRTSRWPRTALVLAGAGTLFLLVTAAGLFWGPWKLTLGPIYIGAKSARKPFTIAVWLLLLASIFSPTLRAAYRRRSTLAFYAVGAVFSWIMCFGPVVRVMGTPLVERAPYAWLLALPGFDGLRVPTRFAIVGALSLAIWTALAVSRLVPPGRTGRKLAAAGLVAVLIDCWPLAVPMRARPELLSLPPATAADAVVLEMPFGESAEREAAALYRGMYHGRPVANGHSGHTPLPYDLLRRALSEGDASPLSTMAALAPLCLVVDQRAGAARDLNAVAERAGAALAGRDAGRAYYLLNRIAAPVEDDRGRVVELDALLAPAARGRFEPRLYDRDERTHWASRRPQSGRETIRIALADAVTLTGIVVNLGDRLGDYPRWLEVDVLAEEKTWKTVWAGPTAPQALRAALHPGGSRRIRLSFPAERATTVRLRQTARSKNHWSMAELSLVVP